MTNFPEKWEELKQLTQSVGDKFVNATLTRRKRNGEVAHCVDFENVSYLKVLELSGRYNDELQIIEIQDVRRTSPK